MSVQVHADVQNIPVVQTKQLLPSADSWWWAVHCSGAGGPTSHFSHSPGWGHHIGGDFHSWQCRLRPKK